MKTAWIVLGLWLTSSIAGCAEEGRNDPASEPQDDPDVTDDRDPAPGDPGVEPDVCGNGLDDDADRQVDEGCACLPGETGPCHGGDRTRAGVGVCAWGVMQCLGELANEFGAWGECTGAIEPAELDEVSCDGLDNDCDGAVDEGCACDLGGTRACYAGPAGTEGVGVCLAGQQGCVDAGGAGGWGDCVAEVLPGAEICDGLDNDCDGVVDQGCGCAAGAAETCYDGPADARGRGACVDGQRTCVAGDAGIGSAWGVCAGWTAPVEETCNAIDDDCDGLLDEGCSCEAGALRQCYSGSAQSRGQGACRDGSQSCGAGAGAPEWGACLGEVLPSAELCNDVDDDCDGETDEGVCAVAPTATCPADVETEPFVTIPLDGGGADADGVVVSWRWEVVAGPAGSAATPAPADAEDSAFTPDIVGVYVLRLTATDEQGQTGTCELEVRVRGLGLRVHVYWNPPDRSCVGPFPAADCDDSDVDLHVLHEDAPNWFDGDLDCYWANCRRPGLRWDGNGRADDPRLDLDDQIGYGPENVNVEDPVDGATYRIGVHYWTDRGYGPSEAYVHVFCGDIAVNPVAEYGPVTLEGPNANGVGNDFWRVADVRWEADGTCTVFDLDATGDALWTETDARAGR